MDKEERKIYSREYYRHRVRNDPEYRDEIRRSRREYYNTHKEKILSYRKEYYSNNREKVIGYVRKYVNANREKIRQKDKEFRETNKEYMSKYCKRRRYDNRLQCLSYYTEKRLSCNCCNIDDISLLTIDHINGGGGKHKIENRIKDIYTWLIDNNYPDGYQVLCHNCNSGKGIRSECPHKWTQDYYNTKISTDYYKYTRIPTLEKFSNRVIKCVKCGENNIFFLAVDHVKGGGNKHVSTFGTRWKYAKWLKEHAPIIDFQVLCHNCNILKHRNGELDHENSNPTTDFSQKTAPNTCIEVENR